MTNTICKICKHKFNTIEAKIFHESIPVNKFPYSFSILKNNKKYFFIKNEGTITKKHSRIYTFTYFYKTNIENDIYDGFKIKKAGVRMPASEVQKRLDSGAFSYVNTKEADVIFKFLNKKFS